MKQTIVLIAALLVAAFLLMGQSQGLGQSQAPEADAGGVQGGGRGGGGRGRTPPEEGIPVTSELVVNKCGSCHTKDDKGNLSRISFERSTPEGWEEAIKRMVRLNGAELEPAEAKAILKYLSTNHGLAPEEAKPVMYMAEHRIVDEPVPSESARTSCMACHAFGKAAQWYRTREDWTLLTNMHIAFFPQADAAFRRNAGEQAGSGGGGGNNADGNAAANQGRGRGGRGGGGQANATANPGGGAGGGGSLDATLDYLGSKYPLQTPAWSAWKARMRPPKIAGKWLVLAHMAGKGAFSGEMTITQGEAEDEFTTSVVLQPVAGGARISRTGTGLVYTGFSWRGRSKGAAAAGNAPDNLSSEMREVMWIAPDQKSAEGRWFWGEYQEFGLDVSLKRVTTEPMLLTADRPSLKTGAVNEKIRLLGANLPARIAPADLQFGPGVTVKSVEVKSPSEIVATVDIAAKAPLGNRDVFLGLTALEGAFAVYDKVDYIKVLPEASTARLGSDVHPKGYQQLEAVAYNRGVDGKLRTADDIALGPLEVTWSEKEFFSTFGDDDREFVGTLDSNGLFTPNTDGPNPQRKFSRNNYGNIWVVATAKNEKDKDGTPLQGRSYLVVMVPTYVRWDQPEVAK